MGSMISAENIDQMRELLRYRKRMFEIEEKLFWTETPPGDEECAQLKKEWNELNEKAEDLEKKIGIERGGGAPG